MKKNLLTFAGVLFLISLASCQEWDTEEVWKVASKQQVRAHIVGGRVLYYDSVSLVQYAGKKRWVPEDIFSFRHEEGYEYTVRVQINHYRVKPGSAELKPGTIIKSKYLLKIIDKFKADTENLPTDTLKTYRLM